LPWHPLHFPAVFCGHFIEIKIHIKVCAIQVQCRVALAQCFEKLQSDRQVQPSFIHRTPDILTSPSNEPSYEN
jgi:hypothetical protein